MPACGRRLRIEASRHEAAESTRTRLGPIFREAARGSPRASQGARRMRAERAMRLEISGREQIEAPSERVWAGLMDPGLLKRCIPGCRSMEELAPDAYRIRLELKVAAVAGAFEGRIGLADRIEATAC